jgi:N6-L-threonylcarbamoyladenine synthase
MIILSIETSCDDTGIAIVEYNGNQITILANIVNTQTIHAGYGGVFPAMAKREHIANIQGVYEEACQQANIDANSLNVDAIAVTVGPGLEPSLWVGITFAKELSDRFNIPIIKVNHMEGHLLSSLLPEYEIGKVVEFRTMPQNAISLLVSGGHTQLVHVDGLGNYTIIGTTLDDAVGEAFDKVARMLDLPYPGGPAISKLAEAHRSKNIETGLSFPRPMLHSKDYNFSFSGLKTAILYYIRDLQKEHSNILENVGIKESIACEFENAAIEVIIKKTVRAIEEYGATHLLLGGGVAANKYLQNELDRAGAENGFTVYHPVRQITGDNALMISMAGYFNPNNKKIPDELKAIGNLKV